MIIHDIVNGKHTHCRKCLEKRADEVKRSTKILKQKCFLLFPTKGLPNPISLPGSSNTAGHRVTACIHKEEESQCREVD